MKAKIILVFSLVLLGFTGVNATASVGKFSIDGDPKMCVPASSSAQTGPIDCASQDLLLACNQTTCEQNCYDSRSRCFDAGRDDCDIAYDLCKKNCQTYCN